MKNREMEKAYLWTMDCRIFFLLCLFTPAACLGQADVIPTDDGDVTMTPLLHATMVLEWKDNTIFIDPYGGAELFEDFKDADLVLITHAHSDHYNKETLKELDLANARLIAPESVLDEFLAMIFDEVTILANGEEVETHGIRVKAVPMYNLPNDENARHPKGWGNGYILTIGGKRFYISGDTEDIPEMRALQNIDYAFVCMNLPFTMSVDQAADAVLEFKPEVVYPFHYRNAGGYSDVYKFKALVSKDPDIEVRLRHWYPEW